MTDFYKEQEKKVAWAEAVEVYVSSPVHKRLQQIMSDEAEKLEKKLRKGTGNLLEDDRIRARLDVWEHWDKHIQVWLNQKQKALSVLAERQKGG